MENKEFKNRVFGCVILKSINSSFNADFTHHPRTLPDGVVYSTDKALKYAIKDYFRKFNCKDEKILFIKRFNENLNPLTLDESYKNLFGEYPKTVKKSKKKDKESETTDYNRLEILRNLLSCVDVRLFGATFAAETNISIHGPVQINHGVNRFPENEIYTEDILSPFRNPGEEGSEEKGMSTIGNQTNLKEGHYVFHLSVNPKNTEYLYNLVNSMKDVEGIFLSNSDFEKLKEDLNNGVTALDSSRKINTENEATILIYLKEDSKKLLPSMTDFIDLKRSNDFIEIDCSKIKSLIDSISADIEKIEVYFNPINTRIIGLNKNGLLKFFNILNNKEI